MLCARTRIVPTLSLSLLILLLVASVGCGKERTGPEPSIATPESIGDLPIEPGLVCRDQLETELLFHGEGLSPMPIDVPEDARAALPDIRLIRASLIDGEEAESPFEVLYSGEPNGPNAKLVTWHDQSSMSLLVNQLLVLADGQEGVLEPGMFDALIVNPNTNEATSHGALAVVPRPEIDDLAPGIVCLSEGARSVSFSGRTFLRHGESTPILSGGGASFDEVDLEECISIAHAGLDAEACDLATFVLGQDTLSPGWHELVLANPDTAGCHTEEIVKLRVVPEPVIDRVEPAAVCSADGTRTVIIHGADLLEIDGVSPDVTMDGEPIEVTEIAGCDEELETTGHAVRACTELHVTIPVLDPADPHMPEIVVTNPGPAGCSGVAATELLLLPKPEIERVVPSLVCVAQGEREVRIEGSGIVAVGDEIPTLTVDGVDAPILGLEECAEHSVGDLALRRCNSAVATIPEDSVEEGLLRLVLENPDPVGCIAEHETALRVVLPPVITSAEPALVCNAQGDSEVILSGTGFLGVDAGEGQVLPEVTVDGALAEVVELAECESLETMDLLVESCTIARITIPSGTILSGNPEVVLTNPAPAGCSDWDSEVLTFVPPPTVDYVEPAVECLASGDRPIIIHGGGFLEVDGEFPSLRVGDEELEVTGLASCEIVTVMGMDVQSCEQMMTTIAEEALLPGPAEILVENPPPADCSGGHDDAFFVIPSPVIADVQPPAICSDDGTATLTLTGSNFVAVADEKPIVALNGSAVDPADVMIDDCDIIDAAGTSISFCETVMVSFPADSFSPGEEITVSITNPTPAACTDVYSETLPVVAPPEITSSSPALVCTDDGSRTFLLEGSGFVSIDGAMPVVEFDGVEGTVESLGGECEATTYGDLEASSCTEAVVTALAGSLSEGPVEVVLINPAPLSCGGGADHILIAPPELVLVSAEPRSLCDGSGAVPVELTGEGFLIIDGEEPELLLDGVAVPLEDISGCSPLSVPDGSDAQSCTTLVFMLDSEGRDEGPINVTVINPDSGEGVPGCSIESSDILGISPPPTITSVEPSAFCEGGAVSLTMQGEGFTEFTAVYLIGEEAEYPAESTTFVSESEMLSSWAEGDVPPGSYDVVVSNGPGCESTLYAAIDVMPTPLIFFIDPEVAYNGMSIQATIYVSGLTAEASMVALLGPSGQTEILDGSAAPGDPNKIIVEIPEGLEAGSWDVQIVSQEGCVGGLTGGLSITDVLTIAIESIDPSYVSPSEPTAVTVTASDSLGAGEVDFQDSPRLYLNPAGETEAVAAPLRAVVFEDEKTVTAVVPSGMDPGIYDLIAVNPDGSAGVLLEGLTVTEGEPPIISNVVPATLTNEAGGHIAEVRGSGFDVVGGVSVSMMCRRPNGTYTAELDAPVVAGTLTETSVQADFPSDGITEHSVCVVRLANSDGAFFRYSAISIKNPSFNLSPWSAASQMNEGRRALSLVAGRPTPASRYLYAIGGDDGPETPFKSSIEQVNVGLFGDLGTWRYGRFELPEGRAFSGVARVGRFIYLTGGQDGAGATSSVLRAEVLDPLSGPNIIDLDLEISEEPGGLTGGLWYYRVSPVFPPDHPTNPGGEGLPGEILPVRLPEVDPDGVVLEVRWQLVEGASGYRVFRTPAPELAAGELELLVAIDDGQVDRLVDDGLTTDPDADPPLRSGSLGRWHAPDAENGLFSMTSAREGHATVAVRHPGDQATYFLYAIGGRNVDEELLDTYEYATITVAPDGTHVLGDWIEGLASLSLARAELGAWVVTEDDTPSVPAGEVWVFVGPGRGAAMVNTRVEAARLDVVVNPGELEEFFVTEPTIGAGRAGYGVGASAGWLFVFGGQGGDASEGALKSEVCDAEVGCLTTWTNVGISMTEPRVLMGSADESAFFFMVGGWNGTEATSTVDSTVK